MELRALGFKKIASMRGGMTRWNEAHLPVVRGASASTPEPSHRSPIEMR
jgi:3-mercaptopyruvate sulfurtransferase SseA